jgi:hypothetical protein
MKKNLIAIALIATTVFIGCKKDETTSNTTASTNGTVGDTTSVSLENASHSLSDTIDGKVTIIEETTTSDYSWFRSAEGSYDSNTSKGDKRLTAGLLNSINTSGFSVTLPNMEVDGNEFCCAIVAAMKKRFPKGTYTYAAANKNDGFSISFIDDSGVWSTDGDQTGSSIEIVDTFEIDTFSLSAYKVKLNLTCNLYNGSKTKKVTNGVIVLTFSN